MRIHDQLREWTRIERNRHPSPTEAIIDSRVKSVPGVHQDVGFDGSKVIKGRKRFLSVDTLGLVLPILITAANIGERTGANECSNGSNGWTKPCLV